MTGRERNQKRGVVPSRRNYEGVRVADLHGIECLVPSRIATQDVASQRFGLLPCLIVGINDDDPFSRCAPCNQFMNRFRPAGTEASDNDMNLQCLYRKSVVEGKSVSVRVDLGGRRIIKKKKR